MSTMEFKVGPEGNRKNVTLYDSQEATGCDDIGFTVGGKYVVTSSDRGTVRSGLKVKGNDVYTEWTHYKVYMPALAFQNVTLKYTHLDKTYTATSPESGTLEFNVYRGDSWSATLAAHPHYILQDTTYPKSGTFTGDILFNALSPVLDSHTVTIVQSSNQTISVRNNNTGTVYTSTFTVQHGTSLTPSISAATGYNAGELTIKETFNASGDSTVDASAASLKSYKFTISQSANQTITVTTNRGSYTSSFTAYYNDTWKATVVPNSGFNAGALSATSGTITGNVSISASAATRSTANVIVSNYSPHSVYLTVDYNLYPPTSTTRLDPNNICVVTKPIGTLLQLTAEEEPGCTASMWPDYSGKVVPLDNMGYSRVKYYRIDGNGDITVFSVVQKEDEDHTP